MPLFEQLDGPALAQRIRTERRRVLLSIKGVTDETLNDPDVQAAVRAAYPLVDCDKPFRAFSAAPSKSQPELPGMR